ncbi:MAG: hypothetical protein ACKN9T_13835 [Candidatus Methylumidiphilus sp.]
MRQESTSFRQDAGIQSPRRANWPAATPQDDARAVDSAWLKHPISCCARTIEA